MSRIGLGPKAKHVKNHVLNQLAIGVLKQGDPLPPDIELARSLGVGKYSVRQAMGELSRAGIVRRVQKRGTVVTLEHPTLTKAGKKSGYALVLPEVRSGIYPSLIKGFAEGVTASHQQSLLSETAMNIHVQSDAILRLVQSNVAGVAIVPVFDPMPDYQLEALRRHDIPVVFCHRRTTNLKAPLIRWSGEEVGRLAGSTLADLGHVQIAFVDVRMGPVSEAYKQGLQTILQQRRIPFDEACVFYGEHSLVDSEAHYAEDLVNRVLDAPDRPTAVFCADDYLSERLFMVALRRGLRVPEDLSIIGFGPTWRRGAVRAGLAAVTVDEMELGRRAVQHLDKMRAGCQPLDSDEVVTLPVALVKGESLGPPPTNESRQRRSGV